MLDNLNHIMEEAFVLIAGIKCFLFFLEKAILINDTEVFGAFSAFTKICPRITKDDKR